MHYNRNNAFLRAGFKVVSTYDPATYARMKADRWEVTSDGVIGEIMSAFGVTQPGMTDLDPYMIEDWANDHGVNVANFTATILVHEFAHNHQGMNHSQADSIRHEVPAFTAGSAFAAKLPGRDGRIIKALSDTTLSATKHHAFS